MTGSSYERLRQHLLKDTTVAELVDLPQGVFKGVVVDNVIIVVQKSVPRPDAKVEVRLFREKSDKSGLRAHDWDEAYAFRQSAYQNTAGCQINLALTPQLRALFKKFESAGEVLADHFDVCDGLIPYKTKADAKAARYTSFTPTRGWRKLLRGKGAVSRYHIDWKGEYIDYGAHLWSRREERFFKEPKVLLHAIRNKSLMRRLVGALDEDQYYNTDNLINVIQKSGKYSLVFLTGLLNSAAINLWYKKHYPNVNINPGELRTVPLPAWDKAAATRVDRLVREMSAAENELRAARSDRDRDHLTSRIASVDRTIDDEIEKCFGLTAKDVALLTRVFNGEADPDEPIMETA